MREVMTREYSGRWVVGDDGRQNKGSLIVDCPSSEIRGGVNSGLIRCALEVSLGQRSTQVDVVANRTIEMLDGQESGTAR